ncbi:uncharacterized protein LOC115210227 [Argonauta hians]
MDSLLIPRPVDVMKLKSFNSACYNGDSMKMDPSVQNKEDLRFGSETKNFSEIFPNDSSFNNKKAPDVECISNSGNLPCGSSPLVAFVNPTATSLVSQNLKPVSSASNSSPVCSSSQATSKNNFHQQSSAQQLIFVKPSVTQSKSDAYMASATEKSNNFMKPVSQTFFGNDCTKLIPVATIVPNNASLITNSKKNVNSDLHGEPVLASQNFKQFKDDKISPSSKMSLPHSSEVLYSNSNNIMTTSPSLPSPLIFSSYNPKPEISGQSGAMPQPLNLTLQVVPQSLTNGEPKKICPNQAKKSKYVPFPQFYPPNMALHPLQSPHPSFNQTNQLQMFYRPVSHNCFNPPIDYSQFQNQPIPLQRSQHPNSNLVLGSAYGQYINPVGREQNNNSVSQAHQIDPVHRNHPITHNSSHFTQGTFNNSSLFANPILLNNARDTSSDPPLALKIDSIYSLADNSEKKCDLSLGSSGFKSSKLALNISNKISAESKENVKTKTKSNLQRPRGRPPQKNPKFVNKKQRDNKPKKIKSVNKPLRESKSVFTNNSSISREDITVSCHANDFESLKPVTEEEKQLNTFFKYLGLCRSSTVNTDKSKKCCDLSVGTGNKISSHCYVSKELARCFSCYLVVPKLNLPSDFLLMDTNDSLDTVKTSEKCSKECRHNFLGELSSTTGIIPRSGEIDSYWKIIPEITKCSHTRKKYCRKSKLKAIANGIGSECKCVGCVSCPSKKPVNHGKMNYLKKKVKTDISPPKITVLKGIREKITTKYSKKEFTSSSKLKKDIKSEDLKAFNNDFRADETMYSLDKKKLEIKSCIEKSDVKIESVQDQKELEKDVKTLLSPEKPLSYQPIDTKSNLTFLDTPKPLTELDIPKKNNLQLIDSSCDSSDRIKRLKEILKEQQRDLEIARQILMSNERETENLQSITN